LLSFLQVIKFSMSYKKH